MKYPDAGINPAKSGLTARAGLYFKAGLHDKGDGFNLQDLDPYLLFDAETSMLGNLENPTLDLDPATPDTLDVITATRAGIATFTAADGQIVTADENTVRVDHVQGEELTPTVYQHIGYTDFSSGWSTYLGSTALGDGYDGQASLVCSFSGNGQSYYYFNTVEGVTYTVSFWARVISGNGPFRLVHGNSATGGSIYINVTSEWQFFSTQFLGKTGGGLVYAGIGSQAGDVVEIAMPQVEEGTTASDFVPNTTGSPKFIASATYGPRVPMLLIEPSATNLVTHSNSNQLNFALDNVSMTYNATSSPDGETNGILFEQTGNNANNSAYNYSTLPTTDGDYCYSVFIKAADSTKIRFRHDNGVVETQDFNPQEMASGTVAGALNLKFEDVGNGWFRVSFTRSLSSAPYHRFQIYPDRNNTQKGVYIFGLQVETGSVATSYIPTSGSVKQRNKDVLVIDGADFSDFYNETEGTFYMELQSKEPVSTLPHYIDATDASASNRFVLYVSANNRLYVNTNNTVVVNNLSLGNYTQNELQRIAASYKFNNFKGSTNGNAEATDTSGDVPVNLSKLYLGQRYSTTYNLNGHIKRLIYWPTHSDSL